METQSEKNEGRTMALDWIKYFLFGALTTTRLWVDRRRKKRRHIQIRKQTEKGERQAEESKPCRIKFMVVDWSSLRLFINSISNSTDMLFGSTYSKPSSLGRLPLSLDSHPPLLALIRPSYPGVSRKQVT